MKALVGAILIVGTNPVAAGTDLRKRTINKLICRDEDVHPGRRTDPRCPVAAAVGITPAEEMPRV
jgi:hypothetical protein